MVLGKCSVVGHCQQVVVAAVDIAVLAALVNSAIVVVVVVADQEVDQTD